DGSVVDGGKAARFGPKRSLTSVNDRAISSSIRFNRNLLLAFKTGTTNFTSFSTDTAAGKPRRSAPTMILVPSAGGAHLQRVSIARVLKRKPRIKWGCAPSRAFREGSSSRDARS